MRLRRAVRASVGCRWISFTTKLPQDVRNMPAEDAFRGGTRLELRWEIFNLLNRVNFDVPNRTFGTPNFGRIFSAGPARQMQLGVKFVF